MLILTRKSGQRILIGDDIVVQVEIHDGRIRVGIDAPREIAIVREELKDRTRRQPEEHP
jgi:carbon storage regulator